MLGSFIVILFVLFGGAVGALIFLHTQSGSEAVDHILSDGLRATIPTYDESNNVLTYRFWNWLQPTFQCCGVEGFGDWANIKGVRTDCDEPKENCAVPRSCCKDDTGLDNRLGKNDRRFNLAIAECMYEPKVDTTFEDGCKDKILIYVEILFYGIPSVMLLSLVFAFIVSASVSSAERRRKAARRGEDPGFNSQYSIGAEEDATAGERVPASP